MNMNTETFSLKQYGIIVDYSQTCLGARSSCSASVSDLTDALLEKWSKNNGWGTEDIWNFGIESEMNNN